MEEHGGQVCAAGTVVAKMFQIIKSQTADEYFKTFSMDKYISMSVSSQGTYSIGAHDLSYKNYITMITTS